MDLNRAAPEVGRRVVTVSPDVSSSTNLGGWVNKVGVWSHEARRDWFADDAETRKPNAVLPKPQTLSSMLFVRNLERGLLATT